MTPIERESRLTAYALNDPSIAGAERAEIEAALADDAAARHEVDEVRELADRLTAEFAKELTESPAQPVAVPSEVAAKRSWWRVPAYFPVAAAVLLSVTALLLNYGMNSPTEPFGFVGSAVAPRSATSQLNILDRIEDGKPPLENPDIGIDPNVPPADMATIDETRIRAMTDPGAALLRELQSRPAKPIPPPPPPFATISPTGAATAGFIGRTGKGKADGNEGVPLPVIASPVPNPDPAIDSPSSGYRYIQPADLRVNGDRYPASIENAFIPVEGQNALSTFGVDVDTASYAIVRNYLTRGVAPPASAVRLEEIVNYFPYQDKPPQGDDPFAVTVEMADCPWHTGHRLARIGLKAKPIDADKRPPSNLVFLIDVSGSMNEPNKLPLVKAAMKMLVNQLGENDRVAIVVYASGTGLVLDSTSAAKKDQILAALDRLQAAGSTNGYGGITQAYEVAVANFIKNGTNRVILCTDGDWNVGTTSTEALVTMIEQKRKTGVFLSVFGFGMGNLRDEMMVKLAGKGNGNYGYIDTLREANKALVEQLGSTLVTVAKDVKIQVEFNPAAVQSYRLLGYEKRALAAKDFADDTKDAGEMGAGHVVTALYELVPVGGAVAPAGDGLKYQPAANPKPAVKAGNAEEAFTVKMRHKKPDGDVSTLRELPVSNRSGKYDAASEDFRFSAAAATFALVLRESAHKGNASLALALELAESAMKHDPSGYRAEFVELIRKAQTISGKR